ncbi:MAG: HAMP domain-containing sensor histidine kinase [Thermomicrobiales bacterium]
MDPTRNPSRNGAADDSLSARLLSLPIFYKVLVANMVIVLVGAIAGTYVTARVVTSPDDSPNPWLILVFVAVGFVLSACVNVIVLRAAFQPIDSLERVAEAVRRGDLSARAEPITFGDPQLARLAETFNDTLGRLQQDQDQLRRLAVQVIGAQEDERKRIARELHDDTAQILFAQLLSIAAMKSAPRDTMQDQVDQLEGMTVDAIEAVRRLALELRPPALDDLGLREALEGLTQRFSEQMAIPVAFSMTGVRERLDPSVELVLYRVAQEALTNVAKHARATTASVLVERRDRAVDLIVEDDGVGFSKDLNSVDERRGLGLGLFGMEERVTLVGGTFSISRAAGGTGTRVRAMIPLHATGGPEGFPS